MTDPVSPESASPESPGEPSTGAVVSTAALADEAPVPQEPAGDAAALSAVSAGVPRPADFWHSGDGVHALDDPTPFGQENALQKLGRPPFEKSARSKFRLLGYLATVYEHVSQDLR